jgi:hypothetical protein
MLAANAFNIVYRGRYYAAFFIIGLPTSLLGPWFAVSGRTAAHGVVQPLWWRIVLYALLGVGTAGGIGLAEALKR